MPPLRALFSHACHCLRALLSLWRVCVLVTYAYISPLVPCVFARVRAPDATSPLGKHTWRGAYAPRSAPPLVASPPLPALSGSCARQCYLACLLKRRPGRHDSMRPSTSRGASRLRACQTRTTPPCLLSSPASTLTCADVETIRSSRAGMTSRCGVTSGRRPPPSPRVTATRIAHRSPAADDLGGGSECVQEAPSSMERQATLH